MVPKGPNLVTGSEKSAFFVILIQGGANIALSLCIRATNRPGSVTRRKKCSESVFFDSTGSSCSFSSLSVLRLRATGDPGIRDRSPFTMYKGQLGGRFGQCRKKSLEKCIFFVLH